MADLFTLRVDMGPDASISVFRTLIDDLDQIAAGTMGLATLSAELQARRYLSDLVANEGLRALVRQVRRRELGGIDRFDDDMHDLDRLAEEFDMFIREFGPPFPLRRLPKRYRYSALLSGALTPGWATPWGESPLEPVMRQLLSAETAARLPTSLDSHAGQLR